MNNVHTGKHENPYATTVPTSEVVEHRSLQPSVEVDSSEANHSYQNYPATGGDLYAHLRIGTNQPVHGQRLPEKIDRSKINEIAATLSSNPEQTDQIKGKLAPTVIPPDQATASAPEPTSDQDDDEWQDLCMQTEAEAPDPELGDKDLEDRRLGDLSQVANSTVFDPQGEKSAGWYFCDRWIPWSIYFLDLLMDLILTFSLHNPSARFIQGFLFFLPYIMLWSSRYNTYRYEKSYLQKSMVLPITAWLNGLPWTGVPMVFVQEWYVILYRVFAFPLIFLKHRYQNPGRPFYLSSSIYNKSKARYVQVLRVVFEDLPTTLLLIVVLARRGDNTRVVFFSMITSLASCVCSIFALVMSADREGRPICLEVFTTLVSHKLDLSKERYSM